MAGWPQRIRKPVLGLRSGTCRVCQTPLVKPSWERERNCVGWADIGSLDVLGMSGYVANCGRRQFPRTRATKGDTGTQFKFCSSGQAGARRCPRSYGYVLQCSKHLPGRGGWFSRRNCCGIRSAHRTVTTMKQKDFLLQFDIIRLGIQSSRKSDAVRLILEKATAAIRDLHGYYCGPE